jgi:hypothetical protein
MGAFLRSTESGQFMQQFEADLERTYHRGAIAGLREARNDILTMASLLPGAELRRLDAMLREHAGVSFDELDARRLARVHRLRETGRLTRDEEYRLVASRLDQIGDMPEYEDEAAELRGLMAVYEARPRRPGQRPPPKQHN